MGLHQGHEFRALPHPAQMVVARELAARGVDVIVGGHPHVLEPIEVSTSTCRRGGGPSFVADPRDPTPRPALVLIRWATSRRTATPSRRRRSAGCCRSSSRGPGTARRAAADVVTDARLTPTFIDFHADGACPVHEAVHDVATAPPWAAAKVKSALGWADLHRFGRWLGE